MAQFGRSAVFVCAACVLLVVLDVNAQDTDPIPIPRNSGRAPYRHVSHPVPLKPLSQEESEAPSGRPNPRRRPHHPRTFVEVEYEQRMAEYEARRKEVNRERQAIADKYYQDYFDRMRAYAMQVHVKRYNQLLEQQQQEKERFLKSMSEFGLPTDAIGQQAPGSAPHPRPSSPFGDVNDKSEQQGAAAAAAPTSTAQKPIPLEERCRRYLPTVRKHCFEGSKTEKRFAARCKGYFKDCQRFVPQADPLYNIAYGFNSNVGLNLGTWDVAGIPYYPINEEGAIGAGRLMNVPFGSWGGGYSDHIGVRDYWSQHQEIGANWYEGKYGYKSGWSVPLVQSLGIEGDTHATVSVPLKAGEAGKPIGVDVGGGVGPYYQQNQHVGVDYLNGQVGTNFGVGVPFAGVGVNTGVGVSFPSVNDFG